MQYGGVTERRYAQLSRVALRDATSIDYSRVSPYPPKGENRYDLMWKA